MRGWFWALCLLFLSGTGTGNAVEPVPGEGKIQSYAWIGNSDFLIFRDRQSVAAIRKNGQTGEETPLTALSKILKENLGKSDDVQIISGVSADAKWCLAWPLGNMKFIAATLDGTNQISWERPSPFVSPRWLAYGHRWFLSKESVVVIPGSEGSEPMILLYDPDTADTVKEIPLGGIVDPGIKTRPLGKYGEFNQIASRNDEPATAKGYEYDVNDKGATRKNLLAVVPESLAARGSADIPRYAPGGKSLLWKIDENEGAAVSFHSSKLDGSMPVLLAEFASPAKTKIAFGLHDPQWSPDGKKFAFLADGVLHTVTVKGK